MDRFLAGRSVLVVEDEMLVLMSIEFALADLGCEAVSVAATVVQALGLVGVHSFDVAMLDVNLNGDPSYPVADALGALGVPFLFSTGYSDHGVRDCYRDRPVLRKPYSDSQLAELLSRVLRGPTTFGSPFARPHAA